MERDRHTLEAAVRDVLDARFPDSTFSDLRLRLDRDDDGEELVFIDVIMAGKGGSLDPHRTAGLARHLIARFESIGETAFPVVSFIAESDLGRSRTEAA